MRIFTVISLFLFSMILFPISSYAEDPVFESSGEVSVRTLPNQREITVDQNDFVHKCFGSSMFPNFTETVLQVEKDVASRQFLINYRFKTNGTPYLPFSNKEMKLLPNDDGIYHVTILRPETKNKTVYIILYLENEEGRVKYILEADVVGNSARLKAIFTNEQKTQVCFKNQIWAGFGGSGFLYKQSISGLDAEAQFDSKKIGSYHFEGRWYSSPRFGFLASYKSAPGEMRKGKVEQVEATDFQWNIIEVATQYREPSWLREWNGLLIYPYLRSSLQHHSMPKLGADSEDNLFFENLELVEATIGIGANIFTSKYYLFEAYLNYKYPIWSRNAQVSTNGLMIDGGIGFGKALGSQWTIGAYWYGHWDQINYQSQVGRDTNPGTLNFIFSNFDIRMGYLF